MIGRKKLLVEGIDDEHVLKHLCGACNGPVFDEFRKSDGIEKLLELLPVFLKASNEGDVVAVIVDADTDLDARWDALRNRLERLGYTVPDTPDPSGTIIEPPTGSFFPRVGLWLMPNNTLPGILEDFLTFLVPPDSALFRHACSSVDGIPENEIRFAPLMRPKALLHTWLAWQEEPGKPLGTAIKARFLDPHAPEAGELIDWLNRLYAV
jgi:hypothetical protein